MKMKFLEAFTEDCKYYDQKGTEVKTILKYVKLKGKRVLDIGTGIGRLAFPLSKYAKEIIALDKNKKFRGCFKKHKKKNIKFINKKLEDYLKKSKKFDVILLAWPTLNVKFLNIIKKAMSKESLLIFITCDDKSDYETIVDKIGIVKKEHFDKDIKNKQRFLKNLPKEFKIIKKRKLKTSYNYPNKSIAFRIIKNGLKLWFNIKLNKYNKENLINLIDKHKIRNKIKFEEIIHFYILKLK